MLIKRHRTKIEIIKNSMPEGLPLIKNAISIKEAKDAGPKGKFIGEIARLPDGRTDLVAEMAKRPNDLWIRVMAIKADEENDNGDFFSKEEIERSYRSFEGCPIFTNHENSKVENAKGKVVMAEWVPEEKAVYCTGFIDREGFQPLCHSIERGYITDVSMGTQVEYSTCSVCENKAFNADEYCDHVKTMKGRKINGKKVFERNYGLKFIELSVVTDGACSDCTIQEILDPNDFIKATEQIQKAANNITRMVKTSGKQELEQLNQCMDLLVNVIQSMLNQRQMIDLEFMKKVADVLAMLQETTDELVDQGYGNAPSPGQEQNSAEPGLPTPGPEGAGLPPPEKEIGAEMANAQGEQPAGTLGRVTEPATAGTQAFMSKATKLAEAVKDLTVMAQKISTGEVPTQGGTQVSTNSQYEVTKSKIANLWANPSVRNFVTEVSENDLKIIIGKDEIRGTHKGKTVDAFKVAELDPEIRQFMQEKPLEFGAMALDSFKTKMAGYAPTNTEQQQEQTFEAQLETQKPPLHPRVKDPLHQVTEGQLNDKKEGYDYHSRQKDEKQSITEKQLDQGDDYGKRQNAERDSITELQLRDKGIKGNITPADMGPNSVGVTEQNQQITEGQLDEASERGNPPTSITEKQLVQDAVNWGRRIASKEDALKALSAVQESMVKTAVVTGATPEELISEALGLAGSAKSQLQAADEMAKLAGKKDERSTQLKRARFNGPNQHVSVKEYMLGTLSDVGFVPEIGLQSLEAYASGQNVQIKLAEAIKAGLEPVKETRPLTAKEILKSAANETEDQVISVVFAKNQISAKNEEEFSKVAFEKAASMIKERGFEATRLLQIAKKKDSIEVMVLGKAAAKDEDEDEDKKDDKKGDKKGDKEDKKEETESCVNADCGKVEARSEQRKKTVQAQLGGGLPMGGPGGTPPAPAGGATPPVDPNAAAPGAGAPGLQELTAPPAEEMPEESEGEALPPGSICPVCGSDNVDVEKGEFNCNSCGAEGELFVEFEITKWPGTIEEKGPEKEAVGEEAEEMAETPEIPQLGLAAKFKINPEMIKVAGKRPVGSWCPRCGSGDVKVAMKDGIGHGKCSECEGIHKITVGLDAENKENLCARIAWWDHGFKKFAMKELESSMQGSKLTEKRAKLEKVLRETKKTQDFAKADLAGKAAIIAELHDKGLIG